VRVNAIAPVARTRMSQDVPLIGELVKPPSDPAAFDVFHPRHVAPLVAYLASAGCPLTGRVFAVQGGLIAELDGWTLGASIETDGEWTIGKLAEELGGTTSAAGRRTA